MSDKSQEREELIISRYFSAPPELVWNAWTDPERLKQWWGPKEFTSPFSSIDLRVGGRYLNCMRGPDGKDYWSTGVFQEVVPPKRLVMTDSFADEKGNVVSAKYYGLGEMPQELLITVTFEQQQDGTRLTLRHSNVADVNETDRSGMEQGWNESFDKLAAYLESSRGKQGMEHST